MPLNANAFVSLDDAKTELKLSSDTQDAKLERLINTLTSTFENVTGRLIKKRTLTDYRVDGNGLNRLFLPFVPTQSVAKIDIHDPVTDGAILTLTDSTQWILKDTDIGLLQLTSGLFSLGYRNVLITMDVGYLPTDVDYMALQQLLLQQLIFDFKRWDQYQQGTISRTFQDGSISFVPPTQLLKEVREGLEILADTRGIAPFA